MRMVIATPILAVLLTFAVAVRGADAAHITPADGAPPVAAQAVDDNDDTRVEVQLIVLGVAAFTVVVVGSGAYLLRRRLGRVKGPPDQNAAGHGHH